jgi:inosose dehydratase
MAWPACRAGIPAAWPTRRAVEEEIEAVGAHLRLLAENGARVMVYGEVAHAIQGLPEALHRRPRFTGAAQWQAYADKLSAFARHLLANGVRLAYHHHMGAYVEAAADIDRLMALTAPEVGLLFDTGHLVFGGGDVLAVLDKHIARVCHVHCKDVRPAVAQRARNEHWSFLQSVLNGVFTVPGDGCIDFGAVLRRLRQHGYSGWLVVEAEQDPAVAPSYQYADMGYRHLRALVDALQAEAV